jgi:hypothetical protein
VVDCDVLPLGQACMDAPVSAVVCILSASGNIQVKYICYLWKRLTSAWAAVHMLNCIPPWPQACVTQSDCYSFGPLKGNCFQRRPALTVQHS